MTTRRNLFTLASSAIATLLFWQPKPALATLAAPHIDNWVQVRKDIVALLRAHRYAITESVDQDTWQQWLREQNLTDSAAVEIGLKVASEFTC